MNRNADGPQAADSVGDELEVVVKLPVLVVERAEAKAAAKAESGARLFAQAAADYERLELLDSVWGHLPRRPAD